MAPRRRSACTRWTGSSGTATCPASGRASATGTGCTAATTRRPASAATRPSCCSTRTPRRSRAACDWDPAVFAYPFGHPDQRNDTDSAPYVPRSVVVNPFFSWDNDRHPRIPYHETVIYEAHVRGLTKTAPGRAGAAARHLPGARPPGGHRAPARARGDRGGTHAGAPVRQRRHPGRTRAGQLLGLQHDRLLRAAQRLLGQRQPRRAGAGVQVHGARPCTRRASRSSSTWSTTTPPRGTIWARRCPSGASTTRPTTGWPATTSGSTWTPRAPATAC